MQCVAFEVADGLTVVADAVQVAAAVIQLFQYAAVGQFGAQAVAQRVVVVADGGAVSGPGWYWRGRLKTENLRACFEARTLPINLEIYAGYGLLYIHLNIYLFKSLAQRIIHPIDLDL